MSVFPGEIVAGRPLEQTLLGGVQICLDTVKCRPLSVLWIPAKTKRKAGWVGSAKLKINKIKSYLIQENEAVHSDCFGWN